MSPEPEPGVVDPRRDHHPDTFYSAYALFKAKWVHQIRPRGRLLEIGCGEGHFLRAATSLGYDVAGVEVDAARVRRVREALGVEVRCSSFEDLQWQEASFDVVYHCDLLSHFADPVDALRKMRALLAPGGILAIEAGTLGGIRPFWYRCIGQVGFPQHRWLYSETSLRHLLTRAGLSILKMQHFGLAPAVALHQSRVLAARAIGSLRRTLTTRNTTHASRAIPNRRQRLDTTYEILEQFFRYRLGAITPRIGPATWLIAAYPAPGVMA